MFLSRCYLHPLQGNGQARVWLRLHWSGLVSAACAWAALDILPAAMSELTRQFEEDYRVSVGNGAAEQDLLQLGKDARADLQETVEAAYICLLMYCAGLRGFEVPRVVLTYVCEFTSQVVAHLGVPLSGRFKLRSNMD